MSKYELLAPAGSYESMIAAVKAGADAIYIGGAKFGARAYAENLETEKMIEAIDYVHLYDKKIYLTLNTLLKNEEYSQLYEYLLPYYRAGLDAVIVQDLGVLSFVREQFPDLDIHASTQMNVTDLSAALFLKEQGVKRIVTARELSLGEIEEITKKTGLEIESFVHGALCYCYSGQCLMSSILGGRSGNRGRCAQPCRLPYEVEGKMGYYLSPKDMCALSILPKLMQAGIFSFKIEGRMKRPEYVAAVTSIYRKYIDLYESGKEYKVSEEDERILLEIYNRGGFHQGYYEQKNGSNMMAVERPNHMGVFLGIVEQIEGNQIKFQTLYPVHKQDVLEIHTEEGGIELTSPLEAEAGQTIFLKAKKVKTIRKGQKIYRVKSQVLLDQIQNQWIQNDKKRKISGKLFVRQGERLCLELVCGKTSCKVEGEIVQAAQKKPLDKEQIYSKIDQLRETEFMFETLEIVLEGNCFLPVSALKGIRREAVQILRENILSSYRREGQEEKKETQLSKVSSSKEWKPEIAVSIMKLEYLPMLLKKREVTSIYIELEQIPFSQMREITEKCKQFHKKVYYMMPYVFRKNAREEYEEHTEELFFGEHEGILVRNIDSFAFLINHAEYHKEIKLDASLYSYNQKAIRFMENVRDKISFTCPLELTEKELKELVFPVADMICYSRFPLMISSQCIKKTRECCDKKEEYIVLRDRYKKEFRVKTNCRYCYNLIYNTVPLSLLDCVEEVGKIAPSQIRLHFTDEPIGEAEQIINDFCMVYLEQKKIRERQKKFTRGHFRRGIE